MRKHPKAFAARNRHVHKMYRKQKNLRMMLQEILWILFTGMF